MLDDIIDTVSLIYVVAILVRWGVSARLPQHESAPWFVRVKEATDPLLVAIRRVVPPLGGFDATYLVAVVVVRVAAKFFIWIL